MDTAHKEAFAGLVAALPPRHQVILATEDDETKALIQKHCSGLKTYKLGEWTPEGPEIKGVTRSCLLRRMRSELLRS